VKRKSGSLYGIYERIKQVGSSVFDKREDGSLKLIGFPSSLLSNREGLNMPKKLDNRALL